MRDASVVRIGVAGVALMTPLAGCGSETAKESASSTAESASPGKYATSVEANAPNRVNLEVQVTDRTTVRLDDCKSTGEAGLTESGDSVCGTFTIADNHTSASRAFVATLEATAP